ncbi:pectate lyase [Vibrio mangrovi]|uniref:Pectate disaccharide-lyase n=1 Tax=Vibrio mangrovi TaxID=474394 RepID=A0A1Y6IT20_9VIBR|nr:pectate lyase [Vibrio mangrovi]MDW6001793.1 pectate lyase [Vibrio mangrovi]SMS00181.1 Pectate disaccharide-lyase [Vibrio mangrovi]
MSEFRSSRLAIVTRFYQQALALAHSEHSPLLADGICVTTGEPVCWTYPDGRRAPMSNFASQQNLMRGLTAMSVVTGDDNFRQQAQQIAAYFLDHYVDEESGLFQWGGHLFVHLNSGHPEGPESKARVHELKHHFPYYDLLHQIRPEVTQNYLKGFWAAHVTDWEKLDLTRHGEYEQSFPQDIFQRYRPEAVVDPSLWPQLPETVGLTFVNASTDLIYAAVHYYRYTGDQDALQWAKHLYRQFVLARHPETGMPVYQFSSPMQREPVPDDDRLTYSWFGDRAARQFGPEFGGIAREANVLFRDCWPLIVDNPLAMMTCAQQVQDQQWLDWVADGLKSYFRYAWDEKANQMIPMWNDGQDMTGYTFVRDGYYGNKGTTLSRLPADPAYLLPLVKAALLTNDTELYGLVARMFARFGLGEMDAATLVPVRIATETSFASAYLIFALLELNQQHPYPDLLRLADVVAGNLLEQHYHAGSGLFMAHPQHDNARLDDPVPYALLAIEAAYQQNYDQIPPLFSTGGYLHGEQRIAGEIKVVYDRDVIYSQPYPEMAMSTESAS